MYYTLRLTVFGRTFELLSVAVCCTQMFMEEMTRKQPDVDKVTKTYKRKPAEPPSSLAERRGARKSPVFTSQRTNIIISRVCFTLALVHVVERCTCRFV